MSGAQPPLGTALPPAPTPGTPRYFALLYTPRQRRPALLRLLALADEIGAGVARGLDHEVAHARLEWWRHEAARYAAGHAQHPWLRALPDEAYGALQQDLLELLAAATLDLADTLQHPAAGQRLRGALFVAAAPWLGSDPLAPAQRDALTALGAFCWRCEHAAQASRPPASATAPAALPMLLQQSSRAGQRALAPLLVWAALAARSTERASPLHAFADNIRAWSVARRAAAGTLTSL